MKKGYKETQLQLLLSPAILLSSDKVATRSVKDKHLNQGHLMLSGLQVRYFVIFISRLAAITTSHPAEL